MQSGTGRHCTAWAYGINGYELLVQQNTCNDIGMGMTAWNSEMLHTIVCLIRDGMVPRHHALKRQRQQG